MGVARGKVSRLLEREGGVLAAKFRPGGFYPFVRVPISTLTDTTVSLRDCFGARGVALERAVRAAGTDASGIAVIEAFLDSIARRPTRTFARAPRSCMPWLTIGAFARWKIWSTASA